MHGLVPPKENGDQRKKLEKAHDGSTRKRFQLVAVKGNIRMKLAYVFAGGVVPVEFNNLLVSRLFVLFVSIVGFVTEHHTDVSFLRCE